MAYIIQAYQPEDTAPTSITIEGREDALETALLLLEEGKVGVRIIGDGRIYNPAEFSLTVALEAFIPGR
jgi:hypothetical protein